MTLRVNASSPVTAPVAAEAPASAPAGAPAKPAGDVFQAQGASGAAPVLSPSSAGGNVQVQSGALGFEAVEPAAVSAAAAKPSYDPAGNLFPALDWLDPAKYRPADPKKLPAQQQSEIDLVKAAQASRTPEQTAIALDLANRGAFSLWMGYADQYAKEKGPIAGALLKAKLAFAIGVDGIADVLKKESVHEPRPYQVDPSIEKLGGDPGGSSYPSGHAASAYTAAEVLADAWPERKGEFFAAAANVARSRVYLGVHFPGDVAAGARLGMDVGSDLS